MLKNMWLPLFNPCVNVKIKARSSLVIGDFCLVLYKVFTMNLLSFIQKMNSLLNNLYKPHVTINL